MEAPCPGPWGRFPFRVTLLAYGGGMYDAQPETLNVGKLLRVEACPASDGPGSKLPDLQLRRWRDVFSACVGWHQGTEPAQLVADRFGVLDAVQRDLCAGLLSRYASLIGPYRDRVADFEPTGVSVRHPSENVYLSAAVALELEGEEGHELLKLRTGRRGSSQEETAVLLAGADAGESVVEVVLGWGRSEPAGPGRDAAGAAAGPPVRAVGPAARQPQRGQAGGHALLPVPEASPLRPVSHPGWLHDRLPAADRAAPQDGGQGPRQL